MDGEVPFTYYAEVNPKRQLARGKEYPFVEMAALPEGGGELSYVGRRVFDGQGSRFAVGDTLFARITPCTENGKTSMVRDLGGGCDVGFGSTEFIVLAARNEAAPEFVHQLAVSPAVRQKAVARMHGTSGRQRVPTWFFEEELTLPLFSPGEQAVIGETLHAIDEAIEKTEAVIAATEDLRKALLQELLTRGVPGWHTAWKTVPGIGTIPACWDVVRLGEVAVEPIRNGFSAGTLDDETGWWLLTLGAVSHRGFVPSGAKPTVPDAQVRSFALRPGDLLVSRSNTSDRVGLAGIYTGTPSNCSYPDLLMRVRVDPGRALVELVEAQLLSGRGRTYFQQQARGTSSSMVKITGDILRAFPLALPCVGEQRKILDVAAAVHDQLTNLADGRIALGELKATMSDALLTGRVRVPMRDEDAS